MLCQLQVLELKNGAGSLQTPHRDFPVDNPNNNFPSSPVVSRYKGTWPAQWAQTDHNAATSARARMSLYLTYNTHGVCDLQSSSIAG